MTPQNHVDFKFSRDWIHAGARYQSGDTVPLAPGTATMLANAGAGQPARKSKLSKRRTAETDGHHHETIGDES